MALTLTDIDRIAHLSRLALPDAERAPMLERLNGFFGLVEAMRAVDTTGVEPMAHAQDLSQRLRDDVVTEQNQREAFQAIAPETEGGLYLVPKVIE